MSGHAACVILEHSEFPQAKTEKFCREKKAMDSAISMRISTGQLMGNGREKVERYSGFGEETQQSASVLDMTDE